MRSLSSDERDTFRQFLARLAFTFAHPRLVLTGVAALNLLTAVFTLLYPPDYLAWAWAWAFLSLVAAGAVTCALCRPSRAAVITAGSIATTLAAARAIAVFRLALFGALTAENRAMFLIGGVMWCTIAMLSHAVWTTLIVPWAAIRRGVRR